MFTGLLAVGANHGNEHRHESHVVCPQRRQRQPRLDTMLSQLWPGCARLSKTPMTRNVESCYLSYLPGPQKVHVNGPDLIRRVGRWCRWHGRRASAWGRPPAGDIVGADPAEHWQGLWPGARGAVATSTAGYSAWARQSRSTRVDISLWKDRVRELMPAGSLVE